MCYWLTDGWSYMKYINEELIEMQQRVKEHEEFNKQDSKDDV